MKCKCVKDVDQFEIDNIYLYKVFDDFWSSYYLVIGSNYNVTYTINNFSEHFEILNNY